MNGLDMAESLLVMEDEAVRFNYALLHDSNILKMLIPFAKDKFSGGQQSDVMKLIEEGARKYRFTPGKTVRLLLIEELMNLFDIPKRRLVTRQDVADQCNRIIDSLYNLMLKENKEFQKYIRTEPHLSKLELIIKFQMLGLVSSFEKKNISAKQMRDIGDSLEQFVQQLPEKQRKQIGEKLGINDITNTTMQKLLAAHGTAVVFAAIVQVAGFAFYTTLTSVVAGIFGFIGITLPFSIYVTLTSAVAVFANPLFFVPVLLLGGGGLLAWQNKKLKKTIAPVVLMQIMLSSDTNKQPDWEAFLA